MGMLSILKKTSSKLQIIIANITFEFAHKMSITIPPPQTHSFIFVFQRGKQSEQ